MMGARFCILILLYQNEKIVMTQLTLGKKYTFCPAVLACIHLNSVAPPFKELDMQVYFRQWWRDPRLAFDGLNLTEKEYIRFSPDFFLSKMWLPDGYFDNEKEGKVHTIMRTNQYLRLYPNGTVYSSTR